MKQILIGLLLGITFSAYAGGSSEHSHTEQDNSDGHHAQSPVGQPAQASQANKTFNVELLDVMQFVFSPALEINAGDIVHFIVVNNGQVRHEFSIGDAAEQKSHAQMMKKMPDMVHEDGNSLTVEPGETREITWQFEGKDTVVFACNIPGHFEAGMQASVDL